MFTNSWRTGQGRVLNHSTPRRPTSVRLSVRLAASSSMKVMAERMMLELKDPQRPRSPVTTTSITLSRARWARSGCWPGSIRRAMELSTESIRLAYGRAATIRSWARFSLEAATSFMALVICWMFLTERTRRRK